MHLPMFKKILFGIGALVGIALAMLGYLAFDIWYQNNYKIVLQQIEYPAMQSEFILLTDIAGFGDRAWYVYRVPLGTKISKDMKKAHDHSKTIFWNYSEAGNHTADPHIEIIRNKYLLFCRGGLYHSLYDLRSGKTIINDESPWGSFVQSSDYGKDRDTEELKNEEWGT